MKADTLPNTSSTSKRSTKNTVNKASTDHQGPLPGNGPWIRVDGVWYTKDAAGEIVPMKSSQTRTSRRRIKLVDPTPPTA